MFISFLAEMESDMHKVYFSAVLRFTDVYKMRFVYTIYIIEIITICALCFVMTSLDSTYTAYYL